MCLCLLLCLPVRPSTLPHTLFFCQMGYMPQTDMVVTTGYVPAPAYAQPVYTQPVYSQPAFGGQVFAADTGSNYNQGGMCVCVYVCVCVSVCECVCVCVCVCECVQEGGWWLIFQSKHPPCLFFVSSFVC